MGFTKVFVDLSPSLPPSLLSSLITSLFPFFLVFFLPPFQPNQLLLGTYCAQNIMLDVRLPEIKKLVILQGQTIYAAGHSQ